MLYVLFMYCLCMFHILSLYLSYVLYNIYLYAIYHISYLRLDLQFLLGFLTKTCRDENGGGRKKNVGIHPFPPAQVEEMCFPWIPCLDLMILKLSWNKLIQFHASAIKRVISPVFFVFASLFFSTCLFYRWRVHVCWSCSRNIVRGKVPLTNSPWLSWCSAAEDPEMNTLPETYGSPPKIGHPKRTFNFQPLIVRGVCC